MIVRVKLLLLTFGVGLSATRKFQDSSAESFGVTGNVTNMFEQTTAIEPQLIQSPQKDETTQHEDSHGASRLNNEAASNKNIREMLRRMSTCRERYFKVSNRTLALKQSGGSTPRTSSGFGRNSNMSAFHCNMSKELMDGLKDKLHQLEGFQDIIVLYPKNRSSNANRLSPSKAQGEIKKYHKSYLPKRDNKNLSGRRRVRGALLKKDGIETNTKVLQASHIYLGHSLYPLFTEESRVIGRDHTLPPPVYTGKTHSYDDGWTTPPGKKRKVK